MSDWEIIKQKLRGQTKAKLIDLIQELTAVSPAVQHFLHARYLHPQNMAARVRPYQQRIGAQFEGDEVWPDFAQIAHIIADYQSASANDAPGTAELYIFTLEAAAEFMTGIGIHDPTFYAELAEIAWDTADHFHKFDTLYPPYANRLHVVCSKLNQAHWEGLAESLYQLEADMDHGEELT